MTVVIVIPVFEEAAAIGGVVAVARAHGPVLVVDDGSRDGSDEVALAAGAEVLRHPRRLGKAQALLTGVAAARRRGAALVVTLDGDGQHDPDSIPALLEAARTQDRTVIVGNRFEGVGALPAMRRNAIRVASFFASWTSGLPLCDTQSGFRVYPIKLFEGVRTRRGGFVFETEILLDAASQGWAVEEVPVGARPRVGAGSRFRPVRDGVAIGGFLAGRVAARWAREARTCAGELLAVFGSDRRAHRHAAILEAAAPYGDSPARWSAAVGAAAARRAGVRLRAIWRGARERGTPAAAVATLAAPLSLPLLLLHAVIRGRGPDVVTPVIETVYGVRRPAREERPSLRVGAARVEERR